MLENQLISILSTDEDHSRNADFISNAYISLFEAEKGIPAFRLIMDEVSDYNDWIIYQMARKTFYEENWGETDDEETIRCIKDNWDSFYSDTKFLDLKAYVEDILETHRYSYYYEECDDDVLLMPDTAVVVNDAQVFILPEFVFILDEMDVVVVDAEIFGRERLC